MRSAPPFERVRSREWRDRLYRPPCWSAEARPGGADLVAWARSLAANPTTSWERAQRWGHADLPTMADEHLRLEHTRVSMALAILDNDPDAEWLRERKRRLDEEIARRRRRPHHG